MGRRTSLLFFLLLSLILHLGTIYYFKPSFFLISNLTNIKIKKNITKVKLIKIKPARKKPRPRIIKINSELSSIPKILEPLPIPTKEKKIVKKIKKTPKNKLTPKQQKPKPNRPENKIVLGKKKKIKPTVTTEKKITKRLKKKKPKPKLDLSSVKKKIMLLKKKEKEREAKLKKLEEERKIREKLKQEAAYFYSNKLVGLIQSLWIFPKVIKDSELPNLKIKVKLRVSKSGKIIGKPVVLKKSNNEIFNDSALRAIEKLNNYKIPLPDVINDKFIDIIITLTPPQISDR